MIKELSETKITILSVLDSYPDIKQAEEQNIDEVNGTKIFSL